MSVLCISTGPEKDNEAQCEKKHTKKGTGVVRRSLLKERDLEKKKRKMTEELIKEDHIIYIDVCV